MASGVSSSRSLACSLASSASQYSPMRSASANSAKFTTDDTANACTRALSGSSIVSMSCGRITSAYSCCSVGPKSVHIWPTAPHAAQRTRRCGCAKLGITAVSTWPTSGSRYAWQPSTVASMATSAAWRDCHASAASSSSSTPNSVGASASPPRCTARRSSDSWPNANSSPIATPSLDASQRSTPSSSSLSSSSCIHCSSTCTSCDSTPSVRLM
mmetsp:Transcript_37053/g.90818  ORF Transcript_37053/g.90818 Transcript_37053/m.90818 type:complete len:214 (-) Transcript_37053:513-1154(-)